MYLDFRKFVSLIVFNHLAVLDLHIIFVKVSKVSFWKLSDQDFENRIKKNFTGTEWTCCHLSNSTERWQNVCQFGVS